MQKLHCILKPGGLFFIGIPIGQDDVGYNCHRTYGRIRLPLMFASTLIFDISNKNYFENEIPPEIRHKHIQLYF